MRLLSFETPSASRVVARILRILAASRNSVISGDVVRTLCVLTVNEGVIVHTPELNSLSTG